MLNSEGINKMKTEWSALTIVFILLIVIMKLVFLKDSFKTAVVVAVSIFWLFILPGFALMYFWVKELDLLERLIIGTVVGIALFGVIGYNLNLLGLPLSLHKWVLPPLAIVIAIVGTYKK